MTTLQRKIERFKKAEQHVIREFNEKCERQGTFATVREYVPHVGVRSAQLWAARFAVRKKLRENTENIPHAASRS